MKMKNLKNIIRLGGAAEIEIDGVSVSLNPKQVELVYDVDKKHLQLIYLKHFEKGQEIKPNPRAKAKFEEFSHYELKKVVNAEYPNLEGVYEGILTRVDYESDKQIFKTDKIKNRRKKRVWTHKISENVEVFFDAPMNSYFFECKEQIEVDSRGIL
jgi:hypothetical protein